MLAGNVEAIKATASPGVGSSDVSGPSLAVDGPISRRYRTRRIRNLK